MGVSAAIEVSSWLELLDEAAGVFRFLEVGARISTPPLPTVLVCFDTSLDLAGGFRILEVGAGVLTPPLPTVQALLVRLIREVLRNLNQDKS